MLAKRGRQEPGWLLRRRTTWSSPPLIISPSLSRANNRVKISSPWVAISLLSNPMPPSSFDELPHAVLVINDAVFSAHFRHVISSPRDATADACLLASIVGLFIDCCSFFLDVLQASLPISGYAFSSLKRHFVLLKASWKALRRDSLGSFAEIGCTS